MALNFPLSLGNFFGGLPVAECSMDLPETRAHTTTRGGEVRTAEVANRLWRGSVTTPAQTHTEAEALKARLHLLRNAGGSFFVFNPAKPAPAHDPDGAVLGAATPTIHTLDHREMRITGLPAGYVLAAGDYLSFAYGDPARYALHQIVTATVTANGSGLTPLFEVVPNIRPGATTGLTVVLIRPFCKALILPQRSRPGLSRGLHTSGLAFDWGQTLL